jgi:hypothetical protein
MMGIETLILRMVDASFSGRHKIMRDRKSATHNASLKITYA